MTIALAKDVEDFLQAQVRAGVSANPSELVNDVLRSVREQQQKPFLVTPELEAWLIAAADKPVTPLTVDDFDGVRKRVRSRMKILRDMSVLKSDDFIADVERQFEWYAVNAGWEVADGYVEAVAATARLLEQHPQLGPRGGFTHPRLRNWRFFVVFRPFKKHILFYEIVGDNVVLRRTMHGHRNLPHRLLEPPKTN